MNGAKHSLKHGNEFPFDAPDTWWNGDGKNPPKPTDWAHSAARGIIADLQDRRGIKQELHEGSIEESVRSEIVNALAEIIRLADTRRE